ncbi:hypothetical protein [Schumannella sp. 10F1B-5-1]|uniref:hypothetical protein n=1 Tax=Schumannella sp. 10F1B-5-1 TaxID=2590780 RepID=UPI0011312B9C|nr:hypothetical protein [Schumannella sp. 10F1B-5-1]TPW78387.1 hypothetical protein FJ658_00845 [Schumannella sp. 10F1B-5-1]
MPEQGWTLLVGLSGVVAGALLSGAFSLVGSVIQGRREQMRWARAARLQAYGDFLAALDTWMDLLCTSWVEHVAAGESVEQLEARGEVIAEEVQRAQSRVVLLGPDAVRNCAGRYHEAVLDRIHSTQAAGNVSTVLAIDLEPLRRSRSLMLAVMNRSLGLGPRD